MSGGRHALLVGIGRYDDARMPALAAPIRDVEAFGDLLRERGGFDVKTSVDDGFPTVREKVMDLTADRGPDDTVLLFYSGHGQRDFSGRLYLTTRRSNPKDPEREGIEASFVQDRLSRCRAARKVVVLDCCYSGAFEEGLGVRKEAPDGPVATLGDFEADTGSGTFVLMASDGSQTIPGEATAEGTSRFTALLLRGLRGEAAPDEHEITAQALASFAERQGVQELGVQPRSSARQAFGRMVLVRNPQAGLLRIPKELQEAMRAESVLTRIGAVWRLKTLASDANDAARGLAARRLLETQLGGDDGEQNVLVCTALHEALAPPPDATGPALAAAQTAAHSAEAERDALLRERTELMAQLDKARAELEGVEVWKDVVLARARGETEQLSQQLEAARTSLQASQEELVRAAQRADSAELRLLQWRELHGGKDAPKPEPFWAPRHLVVTACLLILFIIGASANASAGVNPLGALMTAIVLSLGISYGIYRYRIRPRK